MPMCLFEEQLKVNLLQLNSLHAVCFLSSTDYFQNKSFHENISHEYYQSAKTVWIQIWDQSVKLSESRLRGYKTFFILNSDEHEIYTAHKY